MQVGENNPDARAGEAQRLDNEEREGIARFRLCVCYEATYVRRERSRRDVGERAKENRISEVGQEREGFKVKRDVCERSTY